jgi:hypothetical protein
MCNNVLNRWIFLIEEVKGKDKKWNEDEKG